MAYCPRCRAEYSDQVPECLDCQIPLRLGRRPVRPGPDLEDVLVPVGSLLSLLFASGMLALAMLARQGQLAEPFSTVVLTTQPTCLTAFYGLVVVLSTITLGFWFLRRLSQRRE